MPNGIPIMRVQVIRDQVEGAAIHGTFGWYDPISDREKIHEELDEYLDHLRTRILNGEEGPTDLLYQDSSDRPGFHVLDKLVQHSNQEPEEE